MTFADWNLFDDTEAWRDVTLGTKDERKAKMQDPEMRRRLKEEWDSGKRPTTVVPGSVGSLIVQATNPKTDIGAESALPTLPEFRISCWPLSSTACPVYRRHAS